MSILNECPGEGYKLCRKKLHWYLPDASKRGCRICLNTTRRNRYRSDEIFRQKLIERSLKYEKLNQDLVNKKRKDRYHADKNFKEKTLKRCKRNFKKRWHENTEWREEKKKKTKEWIKKNRHKELEYKQQKRAAKLKAVPLWAKREKIKEIYALANQRTKETGVLHHVDHMYPLRSKWLCGLHIETNLQILTAEENTSKGNRVWPGQLDCQKGSVYDIFSKDLTDLLND